MKSECECAWFYVFVNDLNINNVYYNNTSIIMTIKTTAGKCARLILQSALDLQYNIAVYNTYN